MDGAASWEPCQVLSASLDGQHYLVEWRSNGKQKWVSGLNILFDGETEDDLQRRRAVASTER